MSKFSIDYEFLDKKTSEKKQYKFSEVQHRIEKVAFDIVRFKDGDKDQLWQVQTDSDGDFIIALYSDESDTKKIAKIASKVDWSVALNRNSTELNLFYKSEPIAKVSSAKLDIPASELKLVAEYLPIKLSEDKNLVKMLLSDLSADQKKEILNKYPELG
jgi:hypothetical protein